MGASLPFQKAMWKKQQRERRRVCTLHLVASLLHGLHYSLVVAETSEQATALLPRDAAQQSVTCHVSLPEGECCLQQVGGLLQRANFSFLVCSVCTHLFRGREHAWVCTRMWTSAGTSVQRAKANLGANQLRCRPPCLLTQGLSGLELTKVASELQKSSQVGLLGTGVTGVHRHTPVFHMSPGHRSWVLSFVQQIIYRLSNLPNPNKEGFISKTHSALQPSAKGMLINIQ